MMFICTCLLNEMAWSHAREISVMWVFSFRGGFRKGMSDETGTGPKKPFMCFGFLFMV